MHQNHSSISIKNMSFQFLKWYKWLQHWCNQLSKHSVFVNYGALTRRNNSLKLP